MESFFHDWFILWNTLSLLLIHYALDHPHFFFVSSMTTLIPNSLVETWDSPDYLTSLAISLKYICLISSNLCIKHPINEIRLNYTILNILHKLHWPTACTVQTFNFCTSRPDAYQLYEHPWITCQKWAKHINDTRWCEQKLRSALNSSIQPCPGKWVAIRRSVVYYAQAAHVFSAGIKCRYCMSLTPCCTYVRYLQFRLLHIL